MLNKKKILIIICIIFIICVLCTLSITTLIYYKSKNTFKNSSSSSNSLSSSNSSNKLIEPFDYFTCTMNLNDIEQKFVKNYMNFDSKSVKCGPCEGATLKININPCTKTNDTTLDSICAPNGSITSSQGNPIKFPYNISPNNLTKFFCV